MLEKSSSLIQQKNGDTNGVTVFYSYFAFEA